MTRTIVFLMTLVSAFGVSTPMKSAFVFLRMQFDTRGAEKVHERCSKSSGFLFWTRWANRMHCLGGLRQKSTVQESTL